LTANQSTVADVGCHITIHNVIISMSTVIFTQRQHISTSGIYMLPLTVNEQRFVPLKLQVIYRFNGSS